MSGADGEELKSSVAVKTAFTEVRTELDVQDSSYVAVIKIVEAEPVVAPAKVDLPAVAVAAESPVSVSLAADLDAVLADLDADTDAQSPDFLTRLRARLTDLKGKLHLPSLPTGDADASLGTAGIAATGAGLGAGLTLPTLASGELDLTALPPEVETQLATRYERSRLLDDLDAFDARFADELHKLDADHEFRTEYAALRATLTTPDADLDAEALTGWRARLATLREQLAVKLALPTLTAPDADVSLGTAGIAAAGAGVGLAVPAAADDLDAVLADLDADVDAQSPDFLTGLRARLTDLKGKLALPSLPTGDAGIAATGAGLAAGLTLPTLASGELDLTALPPEVETQLATHYDSLRLQIELAELKKRFSKQLAADPALYATFTTLKADVSSDGNLDPLTLPDLRSRLAALREQMIRVTLATDTAAPLTTMHVETERLRLELHDLDATYGILLPEQPNLHAEYTELQQALTHDIERPEEITVLWRRLVTLRDQLAILSISTTRSSDSEFPSTNTAPRTPTQLVIDPDTQADLVMLRDEMILAATDPFQQHVMQQMFSLTRDNHEWLWHVTLTLTTAAYGYGFNRAAIFLNENTDGTYLRGILGIGNFDHADALDAWDDKPALDFDTYITYLREDRLEHTPVELATRDMIIALGKTDDAFTYVMEHGTRTIVPVEDVDSRLPLNFIERFGRTRYVLLPVRTRSRQLGVLVADNYQTNHQIADDALDGLQRLLNRAALIYLYGTLESTDMA